MSETFQRNNYEFLLDEKKDNYEMINAMLKLRDKQRPDDIVPVFNLDAAYENYKQSGNVEDIVVMLASRYEAAYRDKMVSDEGMRPEFEVLCGEEGVSNAFIISNVEDTQEELHCDDTLIEISTKESSDLMLVEINRGVLLAVPVRSSRDYRECVECLDIIKKESPEQVAGKLQPRLYDRSSNVILKSEQDIEAALKGMDKRQIEKKRSIFARR